MERKGNIVSDVTSHIRIMEDFNFATRLQEEEFEHHYALNRAERRLVGRDTRLCLQEQLHENQIRLEQSHEKICQNDEEFARQLQQQFDKEGISYRETLIRLDEGLARRLQEGETFLQQSSAVINYEEDEHFARRLQGSYDNANKCSKQIELAAVNSFSQSSSGLANNQSINESKPKKVSLRSWDNSVDVQIQNELNRQMASANISQKRNDMFGHLERSMKSAAKIPLATIATRDSTPDYVASSQFAVNRRNFSTKSVLQENEHKRIEEMKTPATNLTDNGQDDSSITDLIDISGHYQTNSKSLIAPIPEPDNSSNIYQNESFLLPVPVLDDFKNLRMNRVSARMDNISFHPANPFRSNFLINERSYLSRGRKTLSTQITDSGERTRSTDATITATNEQ